MGGRGGLLMSFVKLFIEQSVYGRGLTRWGGRALLALFLLTTLKPLARPPQNIFDSLSDQLRETTICLARVPLWFSVLLIFVGYRLIIGAFRSSMLSQIQPDPYGLDTGKS